MEAKEFVREKARMFNSLRSTKYKGNALCSEVSCSECPLFSSGCISYTEEAVDVVEKWSKEHPIKTIKMDFLEKYPNANKYSNGLPYVCAESLGYEVECQNNCLNCWNIPLEEVE